MKSKKQIAEEAISRADTLEEHGDLNEARNVLRNAITLAPSVPQLRALYGRLLHLNEEWKEALTNFDIALAAVPAAASTLFYRGRARAMTGNLDGALADFERTLKLQPDSLDAYYEIAQINSFLGKKKEALLLLRKIESISQEPFRETHGLIRGIEEDIQKLRANDTNESGAGDRTHEEIEKDYQQMQSELTPEEVIEDAQFHEQNGELNVAIHVLKQGVNNNPDNPKLHALLGRALYLSERYHEAIREFDVALKSKPTASSTIYFRARAKSKIDLLDEALLDYSLVLELQPRSADALYETALILEFQKKYDESLSKLHDVQTVAGQGFEDVSDRIETLKSKMHPEISPP